MRRVVPALMAVALLAGCSVQGTPVADPNAAALFDPCEISADAVRATGADPDNVVARDFLGGGVEGWDLCKWSASWYFLTILSTVHSLDEIKNNPNSTDFTPADVGNRDALTYIDVSDPDRSVCDVAFPWRRGSIVVRIDTKGASAKEEDPCVVAVRSANILDPDLPQ